MSELTQSMETVSKSKKKKPKKWHRGLDMTLKPLFQCKGYESTAEVDVSQKEQLIDIVSVRRMDAENVSREEADDIPDIYWEVFENFNKYNLISFKSYSESFNGFALMEFFGHFINYCKSNGYKGEDVNLYAIVNHYPRDILEPFKGTHFLTEVKEKQVYDLHLATMRPVRFIVCSETDNPILALFSGKKEKVLTNYRRVLQETTLFDKLSGYFDVLLRFFGEVITDMYTLEDFKRDFPPVVLPTLPENLDGRLWGVVMEELLLERVTKKVTADLQAEAERAKAEALAKAAEAHAEAERAKAEALAKAAEAHAEAERAKAEALAKAAEAHAEAERAKAEAHAEVERAKAEAHAEAERAKAEAQAESERAKAESKEREIEMVFNILDHRYGGAIPVDEWKFRLTGCALDDLKTLVNQAWAVGSVETFAQLIEELPAPDSPQMDDPPNEILSAEVEVADRDSSDVVSGGHSDE